MQGSRNARFTLLLSLKSPGVTWLLERMLEAQQALPEYRYLLGTAFRTSGDMSVKEIKVPFPQSPNENVRAFHSIVASPGSGRH